MPVRLDERPNQERSVISKVKQPYATKWQTPEGDTFQIIKTTVHTVIKHDARTPGFAVGQTINGKEFWRSEEELVKVFQDAAETTGLKPVEDTPRPILDKQTKQQLRVDILTKLPSAFPGCPKCGATISTVDTDHKDIIQWSCGSWMAGTTFHQARKCKDNVYERRLVSV